MQESGDFLGIPSTWLPLVGFVLLALILAGLEMAWPRHDGARDERRLIVNFGLGIINLTMLSLLPVSAVIVAEWARLASFGALHWLGVSGSTAFAVTILVWSFAIYGMHVLGHRVPLLWRVHRVHHADPEIDLSTGVRHHPLEPLYNSLILSGLTALAGLDGLAIALYALASGAFSLWTHANLRLPERADRALRVLLMTPAAHNVHHSAHLPETDSNYGDVLSVWDRLFRTYSAMPQVDLAKVRTGLGDAFDPAAGHLLDQLALPLRSES